MTRTSHLLGTRTFRPHPTALIAALISAMLAVALPGHWAAATEVVDIYDRVKHDYANSNGVKIHYALLGPTSPPTSGTAPLMSLE